MDIVPKEEIRRTGRGKGLDIRINITDIKELIDAYLELEEENNKLKTKITELETKK